MTKRKAGPPGPAFRKVAPGNNPGRWSSVPCYRNAPIVRTRHPGKRWYRSHEQANLRRDPPVWCVCAHGPLIRS
jgi:hypothetical protein